ncbi:DUF4395 domain-containing protein [Actinomadura luteofluorescens]|uniref:DUF4395 domain-containing protein n=1 Tax=Actinomadura luteofluorescens TaxID=46163 RepID=UPI002164AD9A|nr:DUF4395 domain-containing protein [Actinomadura glauciflava]MCR3740204.1 protein of unknown function (DUF4395) [Actinomadura glauciflava]
MQVDPRGPRFGAYVTTVVLVVVLVTGSWALLAAQAVVFAIATFLGLRYAPYGLVFKVLIRPRLAPPRELEDEAAPRFAQGVGFAFALLGTAGYATGTTWLGIGATALALAAAFLNAAFGFCLGCEMYPLFRRITAKVRSEGKVPA